MTVVAAIGTTVVHRSLPYWKANVREPDRRWPRPTVRYTGVLASELHSGRGLHCGSPFSGVLTSESPSADSGCGQPRPNGVSASPPAPSGFAYTQSARRRTYIVACLPFVAPRGADADATWREPPSVGVGSRIRLRRSAVAGAEERERGETVNASATLGGGPALPARPVGGMAVKDGAAAARTRGGGIRSGGMGLAIHGAMSKRKP
eukprot:gene3433-biopygen5554